MSDPATWAALGTSETPWAVKSHTPSTPEGFGLGTTTHGWRPISVKIQPKIEARKGMGIARMPSRANHGLSVVRPLRVSHSAATARAAEKAARPIMSLKLQYVTARLGW